MSKKKFYRIVYQYEVVSDWPMHHEPLTLEDIYREAYEGGSSGRLLGMLVEEISPERCGRLLIEHGSDPEFLLGDESG